MYNLQFEASQKQTVICIQIQTLIIINIKLEKEERKNDLAYANEMTKARERRKNKHTLIVIIMKQSDSRLL